MYCIQLLHDIAKWVLKLLNMDPGEDTFGNVYLSMKDMWRREVKNQKNWYENANKYWSNQTADMTGVMGGLPEIHSPDIRGSRSFFDKVSASHNLNRQHVLDCGCGIGRVSKYLLSDLFQSVDLVDQCANYIQAAQSSLPGDKYRFFVAGLQDFIPERGTYDCIWIQWVLSHLTDDDLIAFISRIIQGLRTNGIIFIKENTKKKGFYVHKDDYSVTRSEKLLKGLLTQRLQIVAEELQTGFPDNLFKVKMFACVPLIRNY